MIEKPSALLEQITVASNRVLSENSLNPQQEIFIRHIHNTAQELLILVRDIPPTEYALRAIVPVLGEAFTKPQSVLYGYAQMLLEQPASFGGAILSEWQREHVLSIYRHASTLAQLTQQLILTAFEERKSQRHAAPIIFDLNMLIWQHIPVYRYWLRERAIKITAEFPQGLPPIYCNPYHVGALAEHIVITMGRELIEYGKIHLSGALSADKQAVELNIFCTGIQFNHEEQAILFEKQGRHIYTERIAAQKANLRFSHEPGIGATLHLALPLPPRITL